MRQAATSSSLSSASAAAAVTVTVWKSRRGDVLHVQRVQGSSGARIGKNGTRLQTYSADATFLVVGSRHQQVVVAKNITIIILFPIRLRSNGVIQISLILIFRTSF